jgi:WD40 repeat protein/predicted Ser/Thr protein kinase
MWLGRLRADVRARLFGTPPGEATQPFASGGEASADPNRIGRFVVIKRIGQGGMGVIYAAYDDALDRKVAVKLLRPDGHGSGTDGRARLMREAQALARLSHPSVIQVYEVGTYEDQVYVAMEFVDGGTLKAWQTGGNRGWREVLDAYLSAGRGLAAAHIAGIVHRDFKPDNVLVRRDGAVRVVDFGLARKEPPPTLATGAAPRRDDLVHALREAALVSTQVQDRSTPEGALTRTGAIMGTPAYMAPEQHLGLTADARTDQFAYCVALYEALYGFRPFAGENLVTLRENVLAGKIHAPPKYTDIPPHVLRVLERGLQVHPNDRYPDMQMLLADLVRDPRRAIVRSVVVVLALLLATGLGWMYFSAREARAARAEGDRLRAEFERARVLNFESELRRAQSRSVSEKWDDLVLAYAREVIDEDPTTALAALKHLTPENTGWLGAARTIAADAMQRGVIHRRIDADIGRVEAFAWATEGGSLAIAGATGKVAVWREIDEPLQHLPIASAPLRGVAISADGNRIAAACADGTTHLWTLPDAAHRVLPAQDGPLQSVALSPDGELIVTGARDGTVRMWSWDGQTKRALSNHTAAVESLAISGDGSMLASASDDGTIRLWFLDRKTHWVLEGHEGGVRRVSFTGLADLVSLGEDGTVRQWSSATGKSRALAMASIEQLAANPAGELLVLGGAARTVSLHGLREDRDLLGLPGRVTALSLSPLGDRAAVATGDGALQFYWFGDPAPEAARPDGTRITATAAPIVALAASPVGELVASATAQGLVQLWSEAGEFRATLGAHTRKILALQFSPQGFELSGIDENGGIIVWSSTDRDVRPRLLREAATARTRAFEWTPDGLHVAAATCRDVGDCSVKLYPISGVDPRELPSTEAPATFLRFSPDGAHLVTDHEDGPWLWNLARGDGRALAWADGVPELRMAFVFPADGRSLRLASAELTRDDEGHPVSATLEVWHIGLRNAQTHLLFEEPELRRLLADDARTTLLVRTHDERSLLWSLDDDRIRLLPPLLGAYERLLVAPDRRALLLRPEFESRAPHAPAHWVDVEAGEARQFIHLYDPIAWSPGGTIVDVRGLSSLRTWRDPTPATATAFTTWLDAATNVEVDPSTLR